MKAPKYIISIFSLIILISILGLSTISNHPSDNTDGKTIKIGVALYSENDTFLSNMMKKLNEVANKFQMSTGVQCYINIADGKESQETQNRQIERFISLNYDVLCINLVDRTDAAYIIDKAKDAGIPIVFFNREPVQEDLERWDKVYYIGTDARKSAELQASIIIDAYLENNRAIDLNGDGVIQYVMLEGESRHQDAVIRTEVSIKALKDAGIQLEKVDGAIANWDRSQASALVEGFYKKYPEEIELIICNNDDMALGAAEALLKLNKDFKNIVGIDGTPEGIKAVEQGRLLGTVVMDLEAQAQAIFNMAYGLAKGDDVNTVADIDEYKAVRIPIRINNGK